MPILPWAMLRLELVFIRETKEAILRKRLFAIKPFYWDHLARLIF
jgi:hypothetical protein